MRSDLDFCQLLFRTDCGKIKAYTNRYDRLIDRRKGLQHYILFGEIFFLSVIFFFLATVVLLCSLLKPRQDKHEKVYL